MIALRRKSPVVWPKLVPPSRNTLIRNVALDRERYDGRITPQENQQTVAADIAQRGEITGHGFVFRVKNRVHRGRPRSGLRGRHAMNKTPPGEGVSKSV